MKINSPLYWIVSLLFFIGFLVIGYYYIKICWGRWEPAIKARVEQRYGIKINYSYFFHYWTIDEKSIKNYKGNQLILQIKVALINLLVVIGLALLLVAIFTVIGFVIYFLYKSP